MERKTAYSVISALCGIAIANAAYLSYRAYEIKTGGAFDSFCDLNASVSCTNVLAHPLANVFGVPFPVIALFVYPVLLAIALVGRAKNDPKFFKALAVLSGMGMAFNGFIIYRETVFIKAFCILCLLCTAIIVTVFAISMAQNRIECLKKKWKKA